MNTTTEWVSPASNVIAEANKIVEKVNYRNAYQLTGDVLRHVSKITGVPASRLMGHAIITTDAAKVVEAYYLGCHTADDVQSFDTDDLVALVRQIDWS